MPVTLQREALVSADREGRLCAPQNWFRSLFRLRHRHWQNRDAPACWLVRAWDIWREIANLEPQTVSRFEDSAHAYGTFLCSIQFAWGLVCRGLVVLSSLQVFLFAVPR